MILDSTIILIPDCSDSPSVPFYHVSQLVDKRLATGVYVWADPKVWGLNNQKDLSQV